MMSGLSGSVCVGDGLWKRVVVDDEDGAQHPERG